MRNGRPETRTFQLKKAALQKKEDQNEFDQEGWKKEGEVDI
jgi:hypothetical protein